MIKHNEQIQTNLRNNVIVNARRVKIICIVLFFPLIKRDEVVYLYTSRVVRNNEKKIVLNLLPFHAYATKVIWFKFEQQNSWNPADIGHKLSKKVA